MKNWVEYLHSIADREVWGLVVLDYYHMSEHAADHEPPSRFLDRVIPQIWHQGLDVVAFHAVFLSVAVQLLGTDFEEIVAKSLRLLNQAGGQLLPEQLEHISQQYETYGRRSLFLTRAQHALSPTQSRTLIQSSPSAATDQAVVMAPATTRDRVVSKEHLEQRVRAALATFAQPREAATMLQEYMAHFADSGRRKGEEFLRQLRKYDFPEDRVAVVSIGGADGSELDFILRNSVSHVGVLLEMDHGAADIAREKGAVLRRELGKQIEVFEGDATQSSHQALAFLKELAAAGRISGVAYTINAVLHELPARAPRFNLRHFVHSLTDGWQICAVAVREPCRPEGWPAVVEIKCDFLSGPLLSSFAKVVKKWRQIRGDVVETSGDFVSMPGRLAIEVLFKLFYLDDFEYELQESVTAFSAANLRSALEIEFEPSNVDSIELNSDSFNRYYALYGIHCRDAQGRARGKPRAFVGLSGIRLPK